MVCGIRDQRVGIRDEKFPLLLGSEFGFKKNGITDEKCTSLQFCFKHALDPIAIFRESKFSEAVRIFRVSSD